MYPVTSYSMIICQLPLPKHQSWLRVIIRNTDCLNSANHRKVRWTACHCYWDIYRLTGNPNGSGDLFYSLVHAAATQPCTTFMKFNTLSETQSNIWCFYMPWLAVILSLHYVVRASSIFQHNPHKKRTMNCWTHTQRLESRMTRGKVQQKIY